MIQIYLRLSFGILLFLSLVSFLAGCGSASDSGVGCTANVVDGIEVYVSDARTKAPAAEGAVATIREGGYEETLHVQSFTYPSDPALPSIPRSLSGAPERPGTYTVHVEKAGYAPWEVTGVRVQKGDCHVGIVRLEANMQRLD